MKFFSAFPNFYGHKNGNSSQNSSEESFFSPSETGATYSSFDNPLSDNNGYVQSVDSVKEKDSAASAAYLKFVKSHDCRVSEIRKK